MLKNFNATSGGNFYRNKQSLKMHHKSVHLKIKDHKCQLCDASFPGSSALKFHVKIVHHKIKDSTCEICGKSYINGSVLRYHVSRVHLKEKNEVCQICGKRFADSCDLRKHVKGFHEGKMAECKICGKLLRYHSIKNHVKLVHEKIYNYKCDICGKAFGESKTLSRHVDSVHKNIRHECHLFMR